MLLNMKIQYVVRFSFYAILIGVTISSLIKLWEEPTAFDEKVVKGKAMIPSFTLCPNQPNDPLNDEAIESFEDVTKTIKSVRSMYTISYHESKPYEETREVYEKFDNNSYGVWYFAPRINSYSPFPTVICLIFTPSRNYRLKQHWNFAVCSYSNNGYKRYTNIKISLIYSLGLILNHHQPTGTMSSFIQMGILLICTVLQRMSGSSLENHLYLQWPSANK